MSRSTKQAAVAGMLVVGLAALGGCGPDECKDAKPLIGEVRAALGNLDLAAASAAAEKLATVLESTADPDLKVLKVHTKGLVAAIKQAEAPADASRDASVVGLDLAIKDWQGGSARAEAYTCK